MCKKRRVATIATHDLDNIVPPIAYKSAMSHKIKLRPLDGKEHTTVRKYLDYLRASRPEAVKKPSDKPYSVDAAASHISKWVGVTYRLMVTMVTFPPGICLWWTPTRWCSWKMGRRMPFPFHPLPILKIPRYPAGQPEINEGEWLVIVGY